MLHSGARLACAKNWAAGRGPEPLWQRTYPVGITADPLADQGAAPASPPSDARLGSRLIWRLPGSEPREGSRFNRLLRSVVSFRCIEIATVCGCETGSNGHAGLAGQRR